MKQLQTETLLVSSCCHKHLIFIYTTLHNILHQDFYPSWEFFTQEAITPLAPFSISDVQPIFMTEGRDAKMCKRCEQCSCKDFPTGVKILVENFVKGGVNKCQVFVTTAGNHKCLCLWLFHSVSHCFLVFFTVSWCFTLFFNLFSFEMSRITHFW